jgi:2'-5' RNA ligase
LVSDSFTVTRFVLYSSRDSVGGGPYVVEAAYDLEDEEDDNYDVYEVDQLQAYGIDS